MKSTPRRSPEWLHAGDADTRGGRHGLCKLNAYKTPTKGKPQGRRSPQRKNLRPGRVDMVSDLGAGPPGGRVLHVLVVDDNRDAADSLSFLLDLWGYDSRVAYDGQSGLEDVQKYRPDCLILDIEMPGLDGYALAQQVRQQAGPEEVKLVALTAYSDEAHVRKAREAGFDYYLTKPAAPSELKELLMMIQDILRIASKTEELAQQNVQLASQTRELLQEVKQDIQEVKEELREVKEELREVQQANGGDETSSVSG